VLDSTPHQLVMRFTSSGCKFGPTIGGPSAPPPPRMSGDEQGAAHDRQARSPVGFGRSKPQHLGLAGTVPSRFNAPMPATNHPLRFIGPIRYRKIPFAHLVDVQAGEKLALERDLREAPTPISGGMRKALNKELGKQNVLRYRPARRYREPDTRRAYGLLLAACPHCRHSMYFDEVAPEDYSAIRCDRCKRSVW
jgi:hypothetical protein